jgi:hypothetical protein
MFSQAISRPSRQLGFMRCGFVAHAHSCFIVALAPVLLAVSKDRSDRHRRTLLRVNRRSRLIVNLLLRIGECDECASMMV